MTPDRDATWPGDGPVPAEEGGPGTLDRRVVHDGRIVELSIDTVRFPDGSTGELETVRHRGAAAVLPLFGRPGDDDPEVLLLRQYRYATGGELYEVPAGMPEERDGSWEATAARELEEETGWRPGRLRRLTRIFTSPGFCDEVIHLYVGWELEEGSAGRDRDEYIDVLRVPLSRALAWVEEGRIVDGKSVATLLYAASFLG